MKLSPLLSRARRILGQLVAIGVVFALFTPFAMVAVRHEARSAELASATWGLLLLMSFAGWGSALNDRLFPTRRADWGLRCAWGWGVTVAIGGILCVTGLAYRVALFGVIGVGLLFLSLRLVDACVIWARGPALRRRRVTLVAAGAPFFVGAASIFALGALRAFAAIRNTSFNPNDDLIAYFQFAREILDQGTLTQPFSLRRISAYGGKSLLDAVQLAIDVPETHLHLLDKGLATLTVLALIVGHARSSRRSSRPLLLLAMLFVVMLSDIGINTSAMTTATVFFFGLYRTMTWAPIAETRGLRPAIPIALLAAAAGTLRQNYLPTVALLLMVAYAGPLLKGLRFRPFVIDRGAVRDAAITAALVVALLVPWAVLAFRWCGTFLFPLQRGYYNAGYSFFPAHRPLEWCQYVWANVIYAAPIRAIPLFSIAALMTKDRRPRAPLTAIVAAMCLGVASLLIFYPGGFPMDQARYYFGFTLAGVLAMAVAAADVAPGLRRAARGRVEQTAWVSIVVLGLAMQVYEEREQAGNTYKGYLADLASLRMAPWNRSVPSELYRKLQEPVPAHAAIATLTDNPSRFDHARNRIECLDMIGAVSPPPGIPLAAGGEAVAAYLLAQGYRYLIVVSPSASSSLYRRDTWLRQQKDADPVWKQSAHFYLEAFDAFDDLRKTRAHLAELEGMTTLDLATRGP